MKRLRKARKEKAAELEKKGETVPDEESWLEFKVNQILDAMPEADPAFMDSYVASMHAASAGAAERDLSVDDGTTSTSTRVVTPRGVTKPIEPVKV